MVNYKFIGLPTTAKHDKQGFLYYGARISISHRKSIFDTAESTFSAFLEEEFSRENFIQPALLKPSLGKMERTRVLCQVFSVLNKNKLKTAQGNYRCTRLVSLQISF